MITKAALLALVMAMPTQSRAQSITLQVTAETLDKSLRFTGQAAFNLLTRRGALTGQTDSGHPCTGSAKTNLVFSKGDGILACTNGLRATFRFALTSKRPIRGTGTAALSDGRAATLHVFR